MRVLVTAFVYLGEDAGSTHVVEIWKYLLRQQHVDILLPDVSAARKAEYEQIIDLKRIRFIAGTGRPRWPSVRKLKFVASVLWYDLVLIVRVVAGRYDVVYIRQFYGSLAPLLFRWLGQAYMVEVNGLIQYGSGVFQRRSLATFLRRWLIWVEGNILRYATAIITVTDKLVPAIRSQYPRIPESRISVIPNGVDPNLFHPEDHARDNRSDTIFGFSGFLAPWQGLDVLIEALAKVQNPNWSLLVVGDGPMSSRWRRLAERLRIQDKCRFVGRVPYSKVSKFLNSADVLVAPFTGIRNTEIGLSPLKLFEYMACAKPILTTDIPGVKEVVEKHQVGIVVQPDSSIELQRGLEELLDRRSEWAAMGERGRQAVVSLYSWEIRAKETAALLERVMIQKT